MLTLLLHALDLYGRGYSDAPQTTYDTTLYVTQLALLMQHVKWEKAHVVGVSMVGVFIGCWHTSWNMLLTFFSDLP
jgi:pimeloyl-ACP methyl ester carboxylesterase